MQPINEELIKTAHEKYQYAVIRDTKAPTLHKIVDVNGKMVIEQYFTSQTNAQLKLMSIIEAKESKKK